MWVFLSNVAKIILFLDIIGIQSRCRNKNTLITMVGPTGAELPLPPSSFTLFLSLILLVIQLAKESVLHQIGRI